MPIAMPRRERRWFECLLRAFALAVIASAWPIEAPAAGYEGFGATTPGGAGKPTVYVTNLNDSGPGSLREAISRGNRTIAFTVGGQIVLSDFLYVGGAFITIDGSTAPAPGITLRNRGLVIRGNRGAHDVIVRDIRVRNSTIDGIQVSYGAYNVVLDHVSSSSSVDGNLDITEDAHDVTVSWSILGGNEKNMLVKYNPSRVTLHHNVFVDGQSRNPQVRIDDLGGVATQITADIRNNVLANWPGGYATLIYFGAWANVVNNYYTDSHKAIQVLSGFAHVRGNISADGDELNLIGNVTNPFPTAAVTTQDACTAARLVLADAGARPRDAVDQQFIARVAAPTCGGPVPSLQVSPTTLAFDAAAGGADPPPRPVTVVDQAGGHVGWTAAATTTSGGQWLTVTPAGGTSPGTLTVRADPGSLAQGIYRGTIAVTAPGALNSPQSIPVTLVVDPAPSEDGGIDAGIGAGADDAREYSNGQVRTADNYLPLGRGNLLALRFSNVDVPRNAVIQSAVVELYGVGAPTASVAVRYSAEDTGDSEPFTKTAGSLSSRTRTQAFVDDVPDAWVTGAFNASPDLRTVVREVVQHPGWQPGNNLTIFIEDNESPGTRRAGSFEGAPSPSRAARLTIQYQVP